MENKEKSCNCGSGNIFQTVLLVILVIFSAFQVAFALNLTPNFSKDAKKTPTTNNSNGMEKVVRDALLEHEYAKVGGKENYETITALQIAMLTNPQSGQDISTYKQMLEQLSNGTTTQTAVQPTAQPTVEATTLNTLDSAKQEEILKDAVVEGNKDADIVVVEYSDLECPFCVRQNNDNQITIKLKEEFGDKVATVFKNHRGVNHEGTEVKALGVLCANKIGGAEKYVAFYKGIFAGSTTSSYYPVEKLADLAKEVGLDVEAWQSCVDKKELLTQFTKETNEAKSFGLSGTPGTLLFNQKNGKYVTISGAYPYENFQAAVNALLAE